MNLEKTKTPRPKRLSNQTSNLKLDNNYKSKLVNKNLRGQLRQHRSYMITNILSKLDSDKHTVRVKEFVIEYIDMLLTNFKLNKINIACPINKTYCSKHKMSYVALNIAWNLLIEMGLIKMQKGYKNPEYIFGRASLFTATSKLLRLCSETEYVLFEVDELTDLYSQLKDNSIVSNKIYGYRKIDNTTYTRYTYHNNKYNVIEVSPFSCSNLDYKGLNVSGGYLKISNSAGEFTRHYISSKSGTNYQSLSKLERQHLLLNGKKTSSLDWKNAHLQILYAINNKEFKFTDIYTEFEEFMGVKQHKNNRNFFKIIMLAVLNCKSKKSFTRLCKTGKTKYDLTGKVKLNVAKHVKLLGITAEQLIKSLEEFMYDVKEHLFTGIGGKLTNYESLIMSGAAKKLTCSFAFMHDAMICEFDRVKEITKIINKECKKVLGMIIPLVQEY